MLIVSRATALLAIVCALVACGTAQLNRECGLEKFQCHDGQCIASELLCDGRADCRDESDESLTECTKPDILCPSYAFRCRYGACVNGDAPCNGIKDCHDNSDETLPRCATVNQTTTTTMTPRTIRPGVRLCGRNEFKCDNDQCINSIDVCDGRANCADSSDETYINCINLPCPPRSFRCTYGACIDGDLRCNKEENCADGSDETAELCGPTWPKRPSQPSQPSGVTPDPVILTSCKAPSQPPNGSWRLHRSQCPGNRDCLVNEGTELQIGSHLVYSCNPGYKIRGATDVSCSFQGNWLNIPVCTEIRCKALSSASTNADCTHNNKWLSCGGPVPPQTIAQLSCRTSYRRDGILSSQGDRVTCNDNGQWEPEPIRCTAVCGVLPPPDLIPLITNGRPTNATEFPWHASLYQELPNGEKEYFCGASIVQENILITAAHCIYLENTRQIVSASKVHVITGNTFHDFDSFLHDPRLVRKNRVKNIYISCSYLGLVGNYIWDIAILELEEPFVLTTWLVPACLDPFTYGDKLVLEAGSFGKVAGFGRTQYNTTSGILQSITVPFVSYTECKAHSRDSEIEKYITIDKFCAGYTNGTAVCNGDSGGGLVFQTENLWYLRGVVSVALGTKKQGGKTHCNPNLYSIYTRISSHITWIQNIMTRVEQKRPYSLCPNV